VPLPIKKRSGNKKEIKFLLKRTCFGEYSAVISSLPSPKNVDFFPPEVATGCNLNTHSTILCRHPTEAANLLYSPCITLADLPIYIALTI